jgi:hypothetical protein
MQISIVILNEKYRFEDFQSLTPAQIAPAKEQLLRDVQTEVDKLVGTFAGFDITN